jgi:hypothetical protein
VCAEAETSPEIPHIPLDDFDFDGADEPPAAVTEAM